jgi:hypothetical protein
MILSKLNGQRLWERIQKTTLPWIRDGSGVLMANTQSGGIPNSLQALCEYALFEIANATGKATRHLMINRLPPGIIVPIHTDPVTDNPARYHLPLVTNIRHCCFWDEIQGFRFMQVGFWYRVDYTIRHTIMNLGTTERVHLIVDLI